MANGRHLPSKKKIEKIPDFLVQETPNPLCVFLAQALPVEVDWKSGDKRLFFGWEKVLTVWGNVVKQCY